MKSYLRQITVIFICVALPGCASLFGRQLSEEEQLAEMDPVAAMALKLRRNSVQTPSHDLASPEARETDEIRMTVAKARQDIVMGMSSAEVLALWGEARKVEAAGLPGSGNERWTYYEGLSSRWSLSSARVIYFEDGRVAGWEVQKP